MFFKNKLLQFFVKILLSELKFNQKKLRAQSRIILHSTTQEIAVSRVLHSPKRGSTKPTFLSTRS